MNPQSERLNQLLGLLNSSPDDSFLLFAVAKEYEKNSNHDMALSYYLNLIRTAPDYVGCYYHLAKLYEYLEDFEQALTTYTTGMQVARKQSDQHAYSELANAKLNLELEEGL